MLFRSNISSQIVLKLIAERMHLNRAVVMFQKELARRLIAPPGSKTYGRISVMIQYCASVRTIATIPSTVFFPKPQVDSAVIEIDFAENDRHSGDDAHLFSVVKAAFSKRRKTLKNALVASELQLDPGIIQTALDAAGIDGQRRAETLSPVLWVSKQLGRWSRDGDRGHRVDPGFGSGALRMLSTVRK